MASQPSTMRDLISELESAAMSPTIFPYNKPLTPQRTNTSPPGSGTAKPAASDSRRYYARAAPDEPASQPASHTTSANTSGEAGQGLDGSHRIDALRHKLEEYNQAILTAMSTSASLRSPSTSPTAPAPTLVGTGVSRGDANGQHGQPAVVTAGASRHVDPSALLRHHFRSAEAAHRTSSERPRAATTAVEEDTDGSDFEELSEGAGVSLEGVVVGDVRDEQPPRRYTTKFYPRMEVDTTATNTTFTTDPATSSASSESDGSLRTAEGDDVVHALDDNNNIYVAKKSLSPLSESPPPTPPPPPPTPPAPSNADMERAHMLRKAQLYLLGKQQTSTALWQQFHGERPHHDERLRRVQVLRRGLREEEARLDGMREAIDRETSTLVSRESSLEYNLGALHSQLSAHSEAFARFDAAEEELKEKLARVDERVKAMNNLYTILDELRRNLRVREAEVDLRARVVQQREAEWERRHRDRGALESHLQERRGVLEQREGDATKWLAELQRREKALEAREEGIRGMSAQLVAREETVAKQKAEAAALLQRHRRREELDIESEEEDFEGTEAEAPIEIN